MQSYSIVPLGSACPYTLFGGTTFAFGDASQVGGNIGLDAAAGSYAGTGIGTLVMDPSGQFSTTASVDGKVYAVDYADPTPANMSATMTSIRKAYNYAMLEKPATETFAGAMPLDGLVINPGM